MSTTIPTTTSLDPSIVALQTQIHQLRQSLMSASKHRLTLWQSYKSSIEECTRLQQELITLESKLFEAQDRVQVAKARSEAKSASKDLPASPASISDVNKAIESLSSEARESLIQSLLQTMGDTVKTPE